jgi:RNA polymerase primary sigma factor
MFGIVTTHRDSLVMGRRPVDDRVMLIPGAAATGLGGREEPAAGSPRARPAAEDPLPCLRIFEPKSRRSRKADIGRARRLLAADLTYVAHPSFDEPSAREAIVAPSTGSENLGRDRALACGEAGGDSSPKGRFPTREREAHEFRKMNYLKFLARRIRDGIDPASPVPAELDEVERLEAEALELRNRILETHLRLPVSVAKKYFRDGNDLSDRISDGALALVQAVDRFDFARGYRFCTYATWAIINEMARSDRKRRRRTSRLFEMFQDYPATREPESERCEREVERDSNRVAAERLLGRLEGRERRIVEHRHGIGGVPERTLEQIGLEMGISKGRVRQIEKRAYAKLRKLAGREAIEPSRL